MVNWFECESTLTDRYQTTVPKGVRKALKLSKRDKVRYTIRPNGEVVLTRAEPLKAEDPVVSAFLEFLAKDMAHQPERLQLIDASVAKRLQSLVRDVEVDLDKPLSPDDE